MGGSGRRREREGTRAGAQPVLTIRVGVPTVMNVVMMMMMMMVIRADDHRTGSGAHLSEVRRPKKTGFRGLTTNT